MCGFIDGVWDVYSVQPVRSIFVIFFRFPLYRRPSNLLITSVFVTFGFACLHSREGTEGEKRLICSEAMLSVSSSKKGSKYICLLGSSTSSSSIQNRTF